MEDYIDYYTDIMFWRPIAGLEKGILKDYKEVILSSELFKTRVRNSETTEPKVEKPIHEMTLDDYRRGINAMFDEYKLY